LRRAQNAVAINCPDINCGSCASRERGRQGQKSSSFHFSG
jgi:hypothetical protein